MLYLKQNASYLDSDSSRFVLKNDTVACLVDTLATWTVTSNERFFEFGLDNNWILIVFRMNQFDVLLENSIRRHRNVGHT